MLEILCFGFILPPKIRRLAQPRGESTLRWWRRCVWYWFRLQLVGFLIVLVPVVVAEALWSITQNEKEFAGWCALYYFVAFLICFTFAERRVFRELERLPLLEGERSVV